MPREKFQSLTEQMFYILLCLHRECRGVDILKMVRAMTGDRVKIGSGTLYDLLEQFAAEGMIRETRAEGRRRSYIITEKGRQMLEKEHARLRALTAGAGFLIALVLFRTALFLMVTLATHTGVGLPLAYAQPPLAVSDLQAAGYDNCLTAVSADESLLLSRLNVEQRHGPGAPSSPAVPELCYEVYTVKVPALYGFCEGQMKRLTTLSAGGKGTLAGQDAAPWGAQKVYRLLLDGGEPANIYLLCCRDVVARVEFSWEPAVRQMGIVGEALTCRP